MIEAIITAIIGGAVTLIGALIANSKSQTVPRRCRARMKIE